jgi:hypothetical protein
MIDIGTLVRYRDGSLGIVVQAYKTKRGTCAYTIKWFDDGAVGVLSAWQFKVVV